MLTSEQLKLLNSLDWKYSRDKKNILVEALLPWVNRVTVSLFKKYNLSSEYEFGDFMHTSLISMYRALDNYDVDNGDFCAYAYKYMKGGVISFATQKPVNNFIYSERLFDIESLANGDEYQKYQYTAIGVLLEHEIYSEIVADGGELSVLRDNIKSLVTSLESNQKKILVYHYYYAVKLKDIADILQISTARVSQLHKQALINLRQHFILEDSKYG
ncbi:sigma-70 family RNA polymerase sigma factor [Motilimonas cestriensis]|uniref:Sigma-70 family RNA polymerase sigma factor n=1 Tax=Motilimonas cestriensis TaxID=2742685 RepID=A0ABS8WDJ9_9GAMM|nr:sigma-70 family RNA polymerase sigma factor [Motilimonas cestriensis]